MNIEEIREYCLSFPSTTEEFPFDASTLVFKVENKIFLMPFENLKQISVSHINIEKCSNLGFEIKESLKITMEISYLCNKYY